MTALHRGVGERGRESRGEGERKREREGERYVRMRGMESESTDALSWARSRQGWEGEGGRGD